MQSIVPFTISTVTNATGQTVVRLPRPAIIVEGIPIYESEALRELMDIKMIVDTDAICVSSGGWGWIFVEARTHG